MISQVCADIRNYFTYDSDKHSGTFKVEGGVLMPSVEFLTDYYAVFGSRKNNGVHKTTDVLKDEGEFVGSVWIMSVPDDFLTLVGEIADWQKKYGGVDSEAQSPFYSESFGGYSYSKAAGSTSSGANAAASTWQSVYAARLNRWRRARLQ